MTDREFFDALRIKGQQLARKAATALDASGTSDGKMAPHVARDQVKELRHLGDQLHALARLAEVLS